MNKVLIFLVFFVGAMVESSAQVTQNLKSKENLALQEDIKGIYNNQMEALARKNQKRKQSQSRNAIISAELAFTKMIKTDIAACKSIIRKYGFPTFDLVGQEASDYFWQLALKSYFDLDFQKEVLDLMAKHAANNQASKIGLAYLTDRYAFNNNEPQIYGTQFEYDEQNDKIASYPIKDKSTLKQRRAAVGLPTLSTSLKEVKHAIQNDLPEAKNSLIIKNSKLSKLIKKDTSQL